MKKKLSFVIVGVLLAVLAVRLYRPRSAHADSVAITTVTFNREILHILNDHCVMCHTEGGSSFPLETYEQTFFKERDIRRVVLERHMPLWAAVPGYGDFTNSNTLNPRETQFVVSWTDGGAPRAGASVFLNVADNKAMASPVLRAHEDFNTWKMGKPDLVLSVAENTIDPQRSDVIKRTVVDAGLASERWVSGLEFKPGNRRVIRAAFFTVQETGQWIGSWTPWHGFERLPERLAFKLPAGAHIVSEIHSSGSAQMETAKGTLGLYFARHPSERVVSDMLLTPASGQIPDASRGKVSASIRLREDMSVIALWPKTAPGLRTVQVNATAPDGMTQVLLFARDIPSDWPTSYILRSPRTLSKGTQISVVEYYENVGKPASTSPPLLISTYEGDSLPVVAPASGEVSDALTQRFHLAGMVQSVDASAHSLLIQQGDIPGFMSAMTMSYALGSKEDVKSVRAGDRVEADVVVKATEVHLENLKVITHSK